MLLPPFSRPDAKLENGRKPKVLHFEMTIDGKFARILRESHPIIFFKFISRRKNGIELDSPAAAL
jgi:hypothetical protein